MGVIPMTNFDAMTISDLTIERIRLEDNFRQEVSKGRIFAQRETLRALLEVRERLAKLEEHGTDSEG